MRPSAAWRLLVWGLVLAALLLAGLSRLELSYDLGLFLPAPKTPDQHILVERLGESPGSRYVLLAVPDDPPRIDALLDALESSPGIERVLSDRGLSLARPPAPLWAHRYLLRDVDWTSAGLAATLDERLSELALGTDPGYEALVARDPALVSVAALEEIAPGTDRAWITDEGRRVLIAITQAPAFRLEDQARALAAIEDSVDSVFGQPDQVILSGAGVFGVQLRDTIRSEATWRSLWAGGAIVLVLLLVYRRPGVLLLAALPLGAGLVTGLAAVAAVHGKVHGITLAFGFTLMGVAIDYPLHFLSRARIQPAAAALRATWPTLRLSALSTGLAYAALMAGGAEGMAQLGLFSAAGVAGAAATTRWVLPWLVRGKAGPNLGAGGGVPRLTTWPMLVVLLAAVGLATATRDMEWWESDLSALSPVPESQLAREARLRQATGAPNIRYQVALRNPNLQAVLTETEVLNEALDAAVERGLIGDFGDLVSLLPPAATQEVRRDAIPTEAELGERLEQAVGDGPFSVSAFQGFLDDAAASRTLEPLGPRDYEGTDLEGALGQFLYQSAGGEWTALATLYGDLDLEGLDTLLAARAPGARLVDLREASERLVADYRHRTLTVLGGVLLLIAGLLTWRIRPGRAAWTLALVLASVLLTATCLRAFSGPLDLYHVTGLLLVAGIGLDYALFLGKGDVRGAGHAVFACMASTVAAFTVLAASSIPALHSLGSAVALGSLVCFATAWLGSRDRSAAQQLG